MKNYCTQNNGDCETCSLNNYGKDCQNNKIEKNQSGIVATQSGNIRINKKSAYGKWFLGWQEGGGWTGSYTLGCAFKRANELKDAGVSWYMLGKLMASEQKFGRHLESIERSE